MVLQGDLSEFSLPDIIQLVDLSKKTGGVFLSGRRGQQLIEGWLYFRDGKINGANLGNLPPLEAAYTFFTLTAGPFRFHDEAVLEVPTITQSNEMIIMEGIMRQDSWAQIQQQVPSLTMVPKLMPNPASSGGEISLEPEEWRVLTMVSGRNTVGQIAARSGLGELRTCEIVARLLQNGLIEQRDLNLADALFPELEKMAIAALGPAARTLLDDSCFRAGIQSRATATGDQVIAALKQFELVVMRTYGPQRVGKLVEEMRAHTQHVLSGA
jgi:Domain of unknown function (DUF4388)